jgi:hypothetical protein
LVPRHGYRPLDHPRCPAWLAGLGVVLVSQIQQALPGEWIGLVREVADALRVLLLEIVVHAQPIEPEKNFSIARALLFASPTWLLG